jgi:hypothetical protein
MKVERYIAALFLVCVTLAPLALAQVRGDRYTTILTGTVIPVRTNEPIDIAQNDYQVYLGIVSQDVRGDDGRLAIPRGSTVELIARPARNNDLILDLDSVTINGDRYAIDTQGKRFERGADNYDNSLIGTILGAIQGGTYQGSTIHIPRNSVMTFRVTRAMNVDIADRGVDRNGRHYHDYYRDYYRP